jgi:hypothetical protein
MIADIVNQIPGVKSYLELGVGKGRNFEAVECRTKTSVDVNGNAIFTGTTDEFFASMPTTILNMSFETLTIPWRTAENGS